MGNLLASGLSWYAFACCHGNSKLRCYFLLFLLKKLSLSFPQLGACKTKFMKLKCRSSDVYRSVFQIVSQWNIIFMGEQCILGNLGNIGCHCCYFFPISKKGFFLCFTTHKHYAIQFAFFSLHLINFKGVIGVPVAMAPIFFCLETSCHKNF